MIPKYLLLENFMSHIRSEVDFTSFSSALIVGEEDGNLDISNGIGKTALFSGIAWVLYNKSRFSSVKKVIKRGRASCSGTFIFELEGVTYKVFRKISHRSQSQEVSLFIKEGNKWKDNSSDTPSGTSKKVADLVGLSYETFVNSVYFRQFDIARFASATASQRKDILKEILNISE
jgi:DNA repair exonuclease SbcCD ATPase subunit